MITCLLIFNKSWCQSSDFIVYPTLTFYSANAPTVANLTVRQQNITGTITWYNQKTGGTAYNPGDALDPNQSYWAELSGASIGERLQTKIYFADTPAITAGDGLILNTTDSEYYACEGEGFTLVGENLGGLDEFEAVLVSLGFTRLDTGLQNGNTHFVNNAANTWAFYNDLINGDPNISSSVGTPGVSMYMLSDPDLNINRTERLAVWNAITAAGLGGNFYWMGMSQFLNSNEYLGSPIGTQARASAGWFWEDGTYYDSSAPIDPDGSDWNANEPNDWEGSSFNIEEDKLQLRNNDWVDQVGSSTVPARRSGAIIEFNDASGILWSRNDGSGWVTITNATGTELTGTAGTAGTSVDYRVQATFNGSTQLSTTFTVNASARELPTFTQVAPICDGDVLSPLPTTSNEGIIGSWSPALDNTTTTTYTFTPDEGQCAASTMMTITVNSIETPTFAQVAAICSGDVLSPLSTTSNEGITGNWSPAINNTITTTYTFMPDLGQCAASTTMTITVNPILIPTFTQVAAICSGDVLTLPTRSNEGIAGSWSPAINNTTTTTYTFTPNTGQCATNTMMTITVNSIVTPTFTQVSAICNGDVLSPLPITSNEGITGSWSPALDNMNTTTYTFTPDIGECAITQTMNIIVVSLPIVTGITPASITSVCRTNDTATITADGSTGANYQISWTQNNSNVSIVTNPLNEWEITVTALVENTTTDITYRITDISTIDPANNPEGCYDEHTFTFEINRPDIPIADTQQNFCENSFVSDLIATVDTANNEELVWLDALDIEIPSSNWATTALIDGAIYKAVARNTITNCESNAFNVTVSLEPRLTINPTGADLNLANCEDGINTTVFNLTLNENNILGGESTSDYDIGYFTDILRTDRISDPSDFEITNSSNLQTIYIRVFTRAISDNSCYTDAEFTITNQSMPQITVIPRQSLCDGETIFLTIDSTDGNYDYSWDRGLGGPLEISESIEVNTAGTYTVFATNPTTLCESMIERIEVVNSGAPFLREEDVRIEVNSNTNSNVIINTTSLGIGDYWFALDDGAFQDSPIFENVGSGIHEITVNDKNGCEPDATVEIYVFGLPKFFTPNNDGPNDYWQVRGLDTRFYQHSSIRVFDRYGKLLKVFSTASLGWDGTYNGAMLPAEDYWYTMDLIDTRGNTSVLRGHFALVR